MKDYQQSLDRSFILGAALRSRSTIKNLSAALLSAHPEKSERRSALAHSQILDFRSFNNCDFSAFCVPLFVTPKGLILQKLSKKHIIFRKFKENKDCLLMINVIAAPLSLIYQNYVRRSAHRSQLKIPAPLLQLLPACERSLRAEHKRAPLINALDFSKKTPEKVCPN